MLSSSEELDFVVGDFGDTPAVSPQYAELMEVVSRAVSILNIDWTAEKPEALRKSFQQSQPQPLRRGSPLFPDLHTEVTRFSSRISSPTVHHYSSIEGLKENAYGTMPRVEET